MLDIADKLKTAWKSFKDFKQKMIDGITLDKTLHFFAGFVILVVANIFAEMIFGRSVLAVLLGFGAVLLAAFGKEVKDQITYGGFDWWDILATVLLPAFLTGFMLLDRIY